MVLDPPVTVLDTGAVQPSNITLCFRERTSVSDDLDYCPLGQLALPVDNNAGGPPQTLNLGPGADNLNPEYSSANPRIGLLISITRNGALLGFRRFSPLDVLLPLGTLDVTGFREIIDNVRVNVKVGVECAPGFTGPECNTSVITTTSITAATTTAVNTTSITTAPTIATAATATTEETTTTSERPTPTTEGM